jgi:phosphoribosylanthranilate isomerase
MTQDPGTDGGDSVGSSATADDGTGAPEGANGSDSTDAVSTADPASTAGRTDGGTAGRTPMPRVKICGHTRVEDVRASVRAGADAIGVIVDVPVETPREVSVERARRLFDAVPPFVTSVLVTMPETPEEVVSLADRLGPDAIQLHGELPRGDISYLRAAVETRLLVTVPADDLERASAYDDFADALLIDSVDADGGGGTGRTHDWERTAETAAAVDSPVVLAGGLDPENVADAVETVAPYGVDVASGIESDAASDGELSRHDHDAVEAFIASVQEARAEVEQS